MTWDGEERRGSSRDHDVLTRIDANLSNFMSRFDSHIEEDNKQFEKLTDRVGRSEKYIYMALGALLIVEFVIKVYGN